MAIDFGRNKNLFLKKEATYGTAETLAAANAMRFNSFGRDHQPKNRVNSPEKNASPGQFRRLDRKPATSGTGLAFMLQPSGVLNTLSENDPIFECGFGARTNVTLATTVSAAPAPTVNGCTVASAGALAVGDGVIIEITGQTGRFIRKLTGVAGAALTWDPALPAAPASGDDLKGCVTYKLITAPPPSIDALQAYASGKREELLGWGIDTVGFVHDANSEIIVTASGPAKTLRSTATAQAAPGSSTFVGTQNPPSGITDAYGMIDDTVYLIKSADIQIVNALSLRNTEYGVLLSTEQNRSGPRAITVGINAWAETEATLKDKAEAGTLASVLIQTGKTEGNAIGLYLPKVDFAYPGWDDPDAETSWDFQGVGLEGSQGANDEISLFLA
jgi:hypothetical protein